MRCVMREGTRRSCSNADVVVVVCREKGWAEKGQGGLVQKSTLHLILGSRSPTKLSNGTLDTRLFG